MRKRKYDFVFGLGAACSCSQSLRAAGLQLTSLPFDWNGLQTFAGRRSLIETDFADWMHREDFELVPEAIAGRAGFWVNHRVQCSFAHDFRGPTISDEELEVVKAKYRRRIERFRQRIEASRRVLVVWLQIANFPVPAMSEFVEFRLWAEKHWPEISFDVLFFNWKEGLPMSAAEDTEADGVRMVSFDYQDKAQVRWYADHDQVGQWLKRRYSVRDYRSPEERRAWKIHVREKKFARFGVKAWPAYVLKRASYALRKHFSKGHAV